MKIKAVISFYALILLFTLQPADTYGQWQFSFSVSNAYDSNPFRNPDAQSSWTSIFDLGLQRGFESVSVSYIGSFTRFNALMERNFYWHQGAVFGSISAVNWGFYADQRINGDDYELYNSHSLTAYINSQFRMLDINTYLAAEFEVNNYQNLNEIDNRRAEFLLRLNRSFQTGTTFILGTAYHQKSYTNNLSTFETFEDSLAHHGPGRGPGGVSTYSIYSEVEAPSASQLQLWLRCAQSLTATTGIAFEHQRRQMLSGTNRFIEGIEYSYSEESEIFDDPMGYESGSVSAELTQLLPAGMILKSAFYYSEKDYTTQGVYSDPENFDNTVLRRDIYRTAWISLQKAVLLDTSRGLNLVVRSYFQWLNNRSNSFWYNYDNNYVSINLELTY